MDCRYWYRYGNKKSCLKNAAVSHPASLPGTYATLQFPQPDNAGSTWFYPSKQPSAWVVSSKNVVYPPKIDFGSWEKMMMVRIAGWPYFQTKQYIRTLGEIRPLWWIRPVSPVTCRLKVLIQEMASGNRWMMANDGNCPLTSLNPAFFTLSWQLHSGFHSQSSPDRPCHIGQGVVKGLTPRGIIGTPAANIVTDQWTSKTSGSRWFPNPKCIDKLCLQSFFGHVSFEIL